MATFNPPCEAGPLAYNITISRWMSKKIFNVGCFKKCEDHNVECESVQTSCLDSSDGKHTYTSHDRVLYVNAHAVDMLFFLRADASKSSRADVNIWMEIAVCPYKIDLLVFSCAIFSEASLYKEVSDKSNARFLKLKHFLQPTSFWWTLTFNRRPALSPICKPITSTRITNSHF